MSDFQNPRPETPNQTGGTYEVPTYSPSFTEFGPIPMPGIHPVDLWERQHISYFSRRINSSRLLDQCHTQSNCDPRVAAWLDLVERLKVSNLSDMQKTQTVNAWVNEMIKYDKEKDSKVPDSSPDWDQTAFTTLTTGMGECDDIALLKYETLRAVGIKDENMRLVSGYVYDEKDSSKKKAAHEELMVNVDGHNYLLNNNLTAQGWDLKHGGIELASIQIPGEAGGAQYGVGRFVPIASENEGNGVLYYGVTQDKSGSFHLATLKYNPADPASQAQICAANSCIDINRQNIAPVVLQQIRQLILQAHNLNPERMAPSPPMNVSNNVQSVPVNRVPDRRPQQKRQGPVQKQQSYFPYKSAAGMTPGPSVPIMPSPTVRPVMPMPAYP